MASLKEAVLNGLPADNGLYMPEQIDTLRDSFLKALPNLSFTEVAFGLTKNLLGDDLSDEVIRGIVDSSYDFEVPLIEVEKGIFSLELFHGPTLAFKDFAARFMSRLMAHLIRNDSRELTILVATSGDTGGAVANGFHNVSGINVVVLYPKGKVSPLQEKQLTTLGGNVRALEVEGTFDDCQRMVKSAFLDKELRQKMRLTSANSISIARLIPQSFYYAYACGQLMHTDLPLVISVPSGNFGNLTGGLIAKRMGVDIEHFVAATNINDVVPQYLKRGAYNPRASKATISNAMDVGDPSNFARIHDLYEGEIDDIRADITGFSYTDEQTKQALKSVYDATGYLMDPHGAVGYLGLKQYLDEVASEECTGVFVETAHPAKFLEVVEETIGQKIDIPEALMATAEKEKVATLIEPTLAALKGQLL